MPTNTAIILAAGRGSRMKQLTEDKPKCLVKLADKTLLEWQLNALRKAGIKNIYLVAGYRSEMLHALSAKFDFIVIENTAWESSNIVTSLYQAKDVLKSKSCVVAYADIVYKAEHVATLLRTSEAIAMLYDMSWYDLWSIRFTRPLDDAETFIQRNGLLVEIGGRTKDISQIQGQYMGLNLINPTAWEKIANFLGGLPAEQINKLDMTALFSLLIERKLAIATEPIKGGWCEVDSADDLSLYQTHVAEKINWLHDWR